MDLFAKYNEVISKAGENTYFGKCGFVACDNDDAVCGKTLITGINPAVPFNGQYVPTPSYSHPFTGGSNPYFVKLSRFVPEDEKENVGYLDIFPFYEKVESPFSRDPLYRFSSNPR